MIDTRLIIIEGMMGSGKSTLTVFVSRQLRKNKIRQARIMEAMKHPTTVLIKLPNWKKPWLELSVAQYTGLSQQSWERFVRGILPEKTTYVYDGQFFHGDFTVLMMMGAEKPALFDYIEQLEKTVRPLNPAFIYLYQNPVDQALERIANVRGKGWVNHQVCWKVESPYCQARGYSGRDGWVQMYRDYRALTDELYDRLQMQKLAIDVTGQAWPEYEARVLAFLGLSPP
jgi:thymidylate kinase